MIQNFSNFKSLNEGRFDDDLLETSNDLLRVMEVATTGMKLAIEKGLIKTGILDIEILAHKSNVVFYLDKATENQEQLNKLFMTNCKPEYIGTGVDGDQIFFKFKL